MEITITIKAPELATAILALADALGDWANASTNQKQAETRIKAEAQQAKGAKSAAETLLNGQPASAPEPTQSQPAVAPAPTITLEEVRAKLASLSQSGHQAQVKALITSMGATKLTEIPPERYLELLEAARKIA